MAPIAPDLVRLLKRQGQFVDPNLEVLAKVGEALSSDGGDNRLKKDKFAKAPEGEDEDEDEDEEDESGDDEDGSEEEESDEEEDEEMESGEEDDVSVSEESDEDMESEEEESESESEEPAPPPTKAAKKRKDVDPEDPPPAAKKPKEDTKAAADFIPAKKFTGAKPGYYFRKGKLGLGFYIDKNAPKGGKQQQQQQQQRKATDAAKKSSVFSIPRELADFQGAKKFAGAKKGYVFKKGPKGLGYYLDRPPKPTFKPQAKSFGGGGGGGQRGGWANKGGGGAVGWRSRSRRRSRQGKGSLVTSGVRSYRVVKKCYKRPSGHVKPLTPCSERSRLCTR